MRALPRRRLDAALSLVLLILCAVPASAHDITEMPWVIDTDAGLDDLRALAILLAQPRPAVAGIMTSDGVLAPREAAAVVEAWATRLGRSDVPVIPGHALERPAPPFREAVRGYLQTAGLLDDDSHSSPADPAAQSRKWIEMQHGSAVRFLCLGPLTNVAALLEADAETASRIHSIVWAADGRGEGAASGWNFDRDAKAAETVRAHGVPLWLASATDESPLDTELITAIGTSETPAARAFVSLHDDDELRSHAIDHSASAADDITAIVALQPLVARFARRPSTSPLDAHVSSVNSIDVDFARTVYRDRFSDRNGPEPRPYVVLKRYPTDPSMFLPDVAPLIDEIIHRHGLEEWRASLLTNELHRHLGIYSIVGVKMGILARELLDADLNELRVLTWAGPKPPVSCLADGLQVATGASLGRGTIESFDSGRAEVRARFTKGDRSLELKLSDTILERVRSDVALAAERYGNLSDAYFKEIRRLSLRYWLNLDRNLIFDRLDSGGSR